MSLGHLTASENEKVFKKINAHNDGAVSEVTEEPTERVPNAKSWNNLSNKISKVIQDYNPQCAISVSPH